MFKTRQYVVFFFLISSLLFLLARLFFLQVVSFDRFSDMAASQHNKVFKIEPRRGTIFDRYMEPLAINLEVPSIYCDPRNMKDKEAAADKLSTILDIDRQKLLDKFAKDKSFAWVKRKVSTKEAETVKDLDIEGIYFLQESKRNYSNDSMASHIIGFAGVDNDGLEGLELKFNERLRGKPGWRHLMRDAKRRTVLFNEEESIPSQNGYNLVLTIDSVIQYIAEEELSKMALKNNASGATAIVMDPFSGEILALANYPSYDLNEFSNTPRKTVKNAAVADVYEPGSVFKIVTASGALNEGAVSLDDVFDCENGEYKVGGRVLHDYHKYGNLEFREVISKSSNIGTVKVAEKMGADRVHDYIKRFGFGEKTGVEMPGEVAGISRPPSVWSRSDITTIPIGQGIAVTPMQLACAIGVIANGGDLMNPYIIEEITTWEGEVYKTFKPQIRRKVLNEKACNDMKVALTDVVENGTGRRARSKIYDMCGKTGTAQMVNPNGGYYPDKYYASFIGFAPIEYPRISVVVIARDPHPAHFGGSVAGPAFKEIVERTLEYLGTQTKSAN